MIAESRISCTEGAASELCPGRERTIFAGAKAAAREAEAVAALQQQHVRKAVVRYQQHRLYAAPSTLLGVPVIRGSPAHFIA